MQESLSFRGVVLAGALRAFLFVPPTLATSTITIGHDPVGWVVAEQFPQFEAAFDPAAVAVTLVARRRMC